MSSEAEKDSVCAMALNKTGYLLAVGAAGGWQLKIAA